jgi:hypothetical protein
LASTTAAHRRSPESFARFIGDPLNAVANSSCDIASSSLTASPPDHHRHRLETTLGSAYTLERELGGGGMSRVFLAEDVVNFAARPRDSEC